MKTVRLCPGCLQALPEDAPEGLCPQCLAKAAFETEASKKNPENPPTLTQLAPHFPQLEIIELLGQGGMGLVYKARQPHLDRLVALKILPVDSAARPGFAERFNREAKAMARLNHPGIVTVYDFGQTGAFYYFIMEYVDGMNLRQLLGTHTTTPSQALELVVQICTALQYAHDEGVVHRDIKPENILLNKKGKVKIADFGLAKLLGVAPDTALTMSKEAMGTLNYMAPEQRQDAQKVDHRADIYSLGVVFYEMLTGEVPMGRFEPPSKKVQVDVRLDEVVLKALEREPSRRYQQVNEVKTGIETITSAIPREISAAYAPEPFKPQVERLWTRFAISGYEIKVIAATLVLIGFMTWGATALCFRNNAYGNGIIVIVAELGIILSVGQTVYARRAERRAREKGLRPAPAMRQPTFARHVGLPMLVLSLIWLAFFALAPKSPSFRGLAFISGVSLLAVGLPTAIFDWQLKLAGQGLRWKDLPRAITRRSIWHILVATVLCAILFFGGLMPSREQQWREDYFYPKSHAHEKLGLAGHISGYHIPFWSKHSLGGSGMMAIKIYGALPIPATLTVSLPGLLLQQDSADPSKPPQALTFQVLTNWLRESSRLDSAQPQAHPEAVQLMDLFEPYRDTAPGSWQEFAARARTRLWGFDFGGSQSGRWEAGGIPILIDALPIYVGACISLFYLLALRSLKRSLAETRSESGDYRGTPPKPASQERATSKTSAGVESTEAATSPPPSPAPPPSPPRLSRTALAGAACLVLLLGVFVYSSVFDLSTTPLNHTQSVPSVMDAQGHVISTQDIMVSGPGTWWRVAVLVSIVLGTAAALGATGCGWLAAIQIRRSSGALYGFGLALFDCLILPLLLLNFLLLPHGLLPALLCIALDFSIARKVYLHYRGNALSR